MKKLLKILLTASMLFTCFTVHILAEPEDLLVESDDTYTGGNIECVNFTISSGVTLTLENDGEASPYISVFGDITIDGTLNACQDATIRVQPGHTFTGIQFFDPTGQVDMTGDIEEPTDFIYLADMDGGKWVQALFIDSVTFESDFTIDDWYEYVDVTINSGVTITFTGNGVLCVRGNFVNNGQLEGVNGAVIALDGNTFSGIDLYENDATTPVSSPIEGYKEFMYSETESKWIEYIPLPQSEVTIEYDEEMGDVYHYVDGTFEYVQQEDKDDGDGPYRNYFYYMDGEDTFYIKAKDGYIYDHVEAEGDDPLSPDYPGNRIISEEVLPDENIEGTDYKVVKVSTNPKDDNFYFFRFMFVEDLEAEFIEELENLHLALDKNAQEDDLKDYIGSIIHSSYIDNGSRKHISTIFDGDSLDEFKDKINIIADGTETTVTPLTIDGTAQTDYFKYSLTGINDFVGIVYKLDGKDKFILRDGDVYSTINVTSEGAQVSSLSNLDSIGDSKIVTREVTNTEYAVVDNNENNYEIFGNYAAFPMNETGLMQDGQDTSHISIETVWASNNAYSSLNCVLILYTNDFVGIEVMSDEKAEPWDRYNLPFYAINSGEEEASVFYMSDSIEISKPYGSPNSSNITDINFENGEKTWNDCSITEDSGKFEVEFGSIFYDRIPLLVDYENGSQKSVTIVRTGLMPGDFPAPGGSNSVEVFGTVVELEEGKRYLIATQFYYDTETLPANRVKLFVKITYDDGSIESKLVDTPINDTIKQDGSDKNNYRYFDVFELWRGDGNARPLKIETIVFDEGDGDTFGGVKLGSGSGSRWLRERARQ